MGKQTSLLTFTGKIGDLIGYCREGEYFTRSIARNVNQTAGTKRAAHNFGIASRKSRLIRNAFAADLDVHCDNSAGNRMNGMLVKAGRHNPAALAGFQFNKHTGTDKFFPVTPTLSNDGKLHIPAQQVRIPQRITHLEVKLIATRIDFTTRRVMGTDADAILIDLERPFEGASLSIDVPGEGHLLVTLQVRGFMNGTESSDRKFMAADIIAVIEPVTRKIHLGQNRLRQLEWELIFRAGHVQRTNITTPIIPRE